jgi:bacillithiol system protein YtxJ
MESLRTPHAFAPLDTLEQFDALLAESAQRPVAIFKHSPACGTSYQAYDELEAFLQDAADADVFLIDVLVNRQLSRTIAARFHIRHESPQALIIRNGEVRWHGSHYQVTALNVKKALDAAAG